MRSPLQIVLLKPPRRWGFYSLDGGFLGLMFGRVEIRLRWPLAPRMFVRER